MRIIAGSLKGRRIFSPSGIALRPTPSKVRGALFNILSDLISGVSFLDLYAGTGAIGIEAFSRGATSVTFVEQSQRHLQYLKKNITSCELNDQTRVFSTSAEDFLKRNLGPFNLIFIDPPYKSGEIEKILPSLKEGDMIAENGHIVIEHFHKVPVPQSIGNTHFFKKYRYGETTLSFYGKS